jgi:hypothetical protein
LTLTDFETVVQQQEGIFGPLIALSSASSGNVIELQVGSKPTNRAVLKEFTGQGPDVLPDHALICTGVCLVENRRAKIAAYRQI